MKYASKMIKYQKVGTYLMLSGLLWNLNKTEFKAEIKKKNMDSIFILKCEEESA